MNTEILFQYNVTLQRRSYIKLINQHSVHASATESIQSPYIFRNLSTYNSSQNTCIYVMV